jgi:hypothetical protein
MCLLHVGGGGHKASNVKPVSPVGVVGLAGIVPNKTLMEMASKGMIPLGFF